MKTKTVPSVCPVCGSVPHIWTDKNLYHGLAEWRQHWCRCEKCSKDDVDTVTRKLMTKQQARDVSRFGYGACSQTSQAAAIRQWNLMVQRYCVRQIKEAVKPPKFLKPIAEVLEKAGYPQNKINFILKAEKAYPILRMAADLKGIETEFLANLDKEFPE